MRCGYHGGFLVSAKWEALKKKKKDKPKLFDTLPVMIATNASLDLCCGYFLTPLLDLLRSTVLPVLGLNLESSILLILVAGVNVWLLPGQNQRKFNMMKLW